MYRCYWGSEWVRRIADGRVLTYVMDLADQCGLDVSLSWGFKVVSEFRGVR